MKQAFGCSSLIPLSAFVSTVFSFFLVNQHAFIVDNKVITKEKIMYRGMESQSLGWSLQETMCWFGLTPASNF